MILGDSWPVFRMELTRYCELELRSYQGRRGVFYYYYGWLVFREECEHPVILDHFVRFLTHVLLAFAVVELPYSEPLTNVSCEAFIRVININYLIN
jgi:hypothetical protein